MGGREVGGWQRYKVGWGVAGWRVPGHRWFQRLRRLKSRRAQHKQVSLCRFFGGIISRWFKRTGREDSVSQPGLSKQARDHQHSSEVFPFLFTEVIYNTHTQKGHKLERE